jgi:hypothetical protein
VHHDTICGRGKLQLLVAGDLLAKVPALECRRLDDKEVELLLDIEADLGVLLQRDVVWHQPDNDADLELVLDIDEDDEVN